MSNYNLYLNDILRAIKKIEFSIKKKDESSFLKDMDLIDATSMRMQIIGESIRKISPKIRDKYKKIELDRFLRARNIISHAYFAVNPKIIWLIITKDIPRLKESVQKIINELNVKKSR